MQILGRIWIKENNENFLGHGKIELLENIIKTGSIAKAAKEMGMSYKAAWDSIELINRLSLKPLVIKSSGGKGGGGAKVTEQGIEAIKIFREMEAVQGRLLELFEGDLSTSKKHLDFSRNLKKFMLKTSARNQFIGKIIALESDKIYTKVLLQISQNLQIKSIITSKALKELALKIDKEAYILIKANWVQIHKDAKQIQQDSSDINYIKGEITSIKQDGAYIFVTMQSDGVHFSSVVKKSGGDSLESLKIGQKIHFSFNALDVILGI